MNGLQSFRVMRAFAIYRIVYHGIAPSNPAPIVFPIYISRAGGKMHALVLNPQNMNIFDVTGFVRFIKRMRTIPNIERYTGVTMYKILKTYQMNLIRKCYRTYFAVGVKRFALLSTGLVPDKLFTDLEKELSDVNLFLDSKARAVVKALSFFTTTEMKLKEIGSQATRKIAAESTEISDPVPAPPKPDYYNPYKKPVPESTTEVTQPSTEKPPQTTTPQLAEDTDDDFGYN